MKRIHQIILGGALSTLGLSMIIVSFGYDFKIINQATGVALGLCFISLAVSVVGLMDY